MHHGMTHIECKTILMSCHFLSCHLWHKWTFREIDEKPNIWVHLIRHLYRGLLDFHQANINGDGGGGVTRHSFVCEVTSLIFGLQEIWLQGGGEAKLHCCQHDGLSPTNSNWLQLQLLCLYLLFSLSWQGRENQWQGWPLGRAEWTYQDFCWILSTDGRKTKAVFCTGMSQSSMFPASLTEINEQRISPNLALKKSPTSSILLWVLVSYHPTWKLLLSNPC